MKLAYISSLPSSSQSGGADAVNYNIFHQLQKYFDCDYFHINPPDNFIAAWESKLCRKILKTPGAFYHFADERLERIARQVNVLSRDYDATFFRGFTPWISCSITTPYFAYNDVNFQTFFENTFSYCKFDSKDLTRLFAQEARWLAGACAVFYESGWGMRKCLSQYNLHNNNQYAIGRAGHIPITGKDRYGGGRSLLLIANHFNQKGGNTAFEAYTKLHSEDPDFQFDIIGGDPGRAIRHYPGVNYHGYLYKEKPADLSKFVRIISQAFVLIHLAKEDTNPLVITEAGYYGCPAISINSFAIPELIRHNETGILLAQPLNSLAVYDAIKMMARDHASYLGMRDKTMEYNRNITWDTVGKKIYDIIRGSLS